jgi:hypothetical protein
LEIKKQGAAYGDLLGLMKPLARFFSIQFFISFFSSIVRLYTLENGGEECVRRLIAKSTDRKGGSWSANFLENTGANSRS